MANLLLEIGGVLVGAAGARLAADAAAVANLQNIPTPAARIGASVAVTGAGFGGDIALHKRGNVADFAEKVGWGAGLMTLYEGLQLVVPWDPVPHYPLGAAAPSPPPPPRAQTPPQQVQQQPTVLEYRVTA